VKYKVIRKFKDLQDSNYIYNVGDTYPRKGKRPKKERIEELLSSNNKVGKPLIAEVEKGDE